MKISEVIVLLNERLTQHGDVLVLTLNQPDQKRSYNGINNSYFIDCDIVVRDGTEVLEKAKAIVLA